ncbi:MAG: hypothetical protein MUF51_11740 [Vicinamibacteria bacterium]|nr:hypothetical protein [Vicinamibacteria bacterium]
MTVVKPTTLASGECIELTALSVSRACPAGFNTTRAVSFQITARTARTGIEWRRAATSSDLISPTGGSVANNASTSAAIEQTILGNNLVIEVFEGANVLLRFSVQNY